MAAATEADAETGKTGRCLCHRLMASMVLVPGRFDIGLDAAEEKNRSRLREVDTLCFSEVCFIQSNTTSSGELSAKSHQTKGAGAPVPPTPWSSQ